MQMQTVLAEIKYGNISTSVVHTFFIWPQCQRHWSCKLVMIPYCPSLSSWSLIGYTWWFPLKCYKLHQHIFLISLLSWPLSTEEKTGRKGHAVFISLFKTCHINFHFIPLVHHGRERLLRDSSIPNPLLWEKLQLVFVPFICTVTLIMTKDCLRKKKKNQMKS